jgi:Domain of unknown function (DUF4326)
MRTRISTLAAAAAVDELGGRDLACWCRTGPCHADVLLALAAGLQPTLPRRAAAVAGAEDRKRASGPAPAGTAERGRPVDLSAELGEPAGSWQVAETAPGSGSWAVLRDGARGWAWCGGSRPRAVAAGGWPAWTPASRCPPTATWPPPPAAPCGAPATWPPRRSPARCPRARHGAGAVGSSSGLRPGSASLLVAAAPADPSVREPATPGPGAHGRRRPRLSAPSTFVCWPTSSSARSGRGRTSLQGDDHA